MVPPVIESDFDTFEGVIWCNLDVSIGRRKKRMSLFAELKRRNVFRVAIAYIVLAWILLQVGDTMAPALHLPDWANSLLAFFIILGFPLAMFFAWAFEMTPDGLKLEKNVDRDVSITPTTGRVLDRSIIALLVVALGYFLWDSQLSSSSVEESTVESDQHSIAVLPFVNMSSDAEQEYFSDGLSEELLNLLAKIPQLRVTSRSSAFSFKGKAFKISDVGRELNVTHVLEGSVRKSGNKVRITVQLIKVENDAHIWSNTWDRNLDDVFAIQDEIAAAVVKELKVRLLGELPRAIATDAESYSLFLRARHALYQRTFESLGRGEILIKKALTIDPEYVPAWVLLGSIYGSQATVGLKYPVDVLPLASAAANKALQIDPNFGPAHAMLARILAAFGQDYGEAKREMDIALSLAPNEVRTIQQASVLEYVTGNYAEGLRLATLAATSDPLYTPAYSALGYALLFLDQPELAVESYQKLLEISPNSIGASYYLSNALVQAGNFEEALEVIENEKLDGFKHTGLALAHYSAGHQAESDAALASMYAVEIDGWDYQFAIVHAHRGEIDEAIAALENAYRNRDSGMQLVLGDFFLDRLRDDPRFIALVDRMGIRLYPADVL